jgi:hypothetical protein
MIHSMKKGPVVVILVPGMIQPSGPGRAFEAVEAIEVAEAGEVQETAEVLRPDKSLMRTSESSRFLNLALF